MSRTTIHVALLAIVASSTSGYAYGERKADLSQLRTGTHCELSTKETVSGNRRSSTIYLGTVKELSDESVTLDDVSVSYRNEKSTPVLSSIPYVKRFFKTVGIGRTHLKEKVVVIPLKDIAWNKTVTAGEFSMRSAIPAENVVRRQGDNTPK